MATTKAKRSVTRSAKATPAAPAPVTPAPVSTTLSAKASELVRWYCAITHHCPADAVEGAVHGTLERAKEAYEGPWGCDDCFDWLLEDVLAGIYDEERRPLAGRTAWGGGLTHRLSVEASQLLVRYLREGGDQDPRDVVSACVLCLLGSALDDSGLDLSEAIERTREQRLADEAEKRRQDAATAAYVAGSGKGVAA